MNLLKATLEINGTTIEMNRVTRHRSWNMKAVKVTCGTSLGTFNMDDEDETTFRHAMGIAARVYGKTRKGLPNCSNSDIHEIWNLMKQVAGV